MTNSSQLAHGDALHVMVVHSHMTDSSQLVHGDALHVMVVHSHMTASSQLVHGDALHVMVVHSHMTSSSHGDAWRISDNRTPLKLPMFHVRPSLLLV